MMTRPRAFTIIELLIVMTMLAILAAIVVPRLVDASDEARESALGTDLQMLRRQIRMYLAQHGERGPHLKENGQADTGNLKARLLGRTDESGRLNPAGRFGPYMKEWPTNPFAPSAVAGDVVLGVQTNPPRDNSSGWYYNTTTCLISPNSSRGGRDFDAALTEAEAEAVVAGH